MIPRGHSLCSICGSITDEILFYDPNKKIAVQYHPGNHSVTTSNHTSDQATLDSYDHEDNIPKTIAVRYDTAPAEKVTLKHRICPHCWNKNARTTILPSWSGQYRCYVVGMAGATSAGKTHWMRSVTWAPSFLRYMKHTLRPLGDHALNHSSVRMDPTQKGMFDIRDFEVMDNHGRTRCILRLIDLSGEYYMPKDPLSIEDIPYLPYCDAVHYILDSSLSEPINNLNFAFREIQNAASDRVRIAVSFAKSDKLRQRVRRQDPTLCYTDQTGSCIPILNENSLCFQQTPIHESLQPFALRMNLNRHIIQKLNPLLDLGMLSEQEYLGNVGYFILSNGIEIDEKTFDYDKQRCVYDPLFWILYSLGLYDFPEEDYA